MKKKLSVQDQVDSLFQAIKDICDKHKLRTSVIIENFADFMSDAVYPRLDTPSCEKSPWKLFYSSTNLEDQTNCLVVYKYEDDTYSIPHIAYWDKDERGFFSLLPNHAIPLYVDFYMEIPEVKK